MAILKFKTAEVVRCAKHALAAEKHRPDYDGAANGPALWLVGDRGVYLMSNGDPADKISADGEPTKLFVAYAEGINPEVDDFDDWWNLKRTTFGGDDGVERLEWCAQILELAKLPENAKFLTVFISENEVKLL